MANVLMTEGFDMYNGTGTNVGLQSQWIFSDTAAGVVQIVAGRFSGSQGMAIFNHNLQAQSARRVFDPSAVTTSTSFGLAFQIVSLAGEQLIAQVDNANANPLFSIGVTTGGAIFAANGSGGSKLTMSGAGLVNVNTWYYLEVEAILNNSSGRVGIYLSGISAGSATNVNTLSSGGAAAFLRLWGGGAGVGGGTGISFDDVYVTNTSARLGESKIETLRPTGDSTTAWTPSSGTTNYSRVNETLIDGDTTYVQTATIGARDLYTVNPLSTTPSSISAVTIVALAEKTDATHRQLYNSVRSASTDSDGSAVSLTSSYTRIDRVLNTDPATLTAWTASGVNNLLIGPKAA